MQLFELRPGCHLLGEQRGLNAVEQAFEPADQLRLSDPNHRLRWNLVDVERLEYPVELTRQFGREYTSQLHKRLLMNLAEPPPTGLTG